MTNDLFMNDSELAVLSIILNNPDTAFNSTIKPFMFSTGSHQLIAQTITEIVAEHAIPEYSMVCSYLDSKGKLRDAGGADYILHIKNLQFDKSNQKEYEKQLRNGYRARSLVKIGSTINSKVFEGGDVDKVISDLKHNLDSLDQTEGGEQVVNLGTALEGMWTDLVNRVRNPGIRGIPTGFDATDLITGGYVAGDEWIIAGRPGMGKTAVMCNSAVEVAKSLQQEGKGQSVQIFSLEMNKIGLTERMVSMESGVPLADIRLGTISNDQLQKVAETIKKLKDLPLYIDTNFDTDDQYFASMVRKYNKTKGTRIVFFDYIQLASERDANQTAEIGRFTRMGKILANELGITTILFSQLNRAVELREDKRPVLSDLRQSGNIEEDADLVMFLYRDDYYNQKSLNKGEMEHIIRKHRNGPTGSLWYNFGLDTLKVSKK